MRNAKCGMMNEGGDVMRAGRALNGLARDAGKEAVSAFLAAARFPVPHSAFGVPCFQARPSRAS